MITIRPAADEPIAAILDLIGELDPDVVPPLSARVDLREYAEKLAAHAMLLGAYDDGRLVGLAAFYCNDPRARRAFLSFLGVARPQRGLGVSSLLLDATFAACREAGMDAIRLETSVGNRPAVALYERCGFRRVEPGPGAALAPDALFMERPLAAPDDGRPGPTTSAPTPGEVQR